MRISDLSSDVCSSDLIVENALRRISERQHHYGRTLRPEERLSVVAQAAREMIRPTVFGQAIIILVYVPLLTLTGVEGKTFTPMALTVIMALVSAFVLSLTFVPAMLAIWLSKPVEEKEGRIMSWLKRRYEPGLHQAMKRATLTMGVGVGAFLAAILTFSFLGQEFLPQLDEGDLTAQVLRVPGTSVDQSQAMQSRIEQEIAKLPEVRFVFSKTGPAELASDPLPPNISATFIIMKPKSKWPDEGLSQASPLEKVETVLESIPGGAFEITQPIQMPFNELIAGEVGRGARMERGCQYV